MAPAIGLEGGFTTPNSAIAGTSRSEASERLESSNNPENQSALRADALSSNVGDRSPNVSYSAMKASAQESSNAGMQAMLGEATIVGLEQSSTASPQKQEKANFESQSSAGAGGGDVRQGAGTGAEGRPPAGAGGADVPGGSSHGTEGPPPGGIGGDGNHGGGGGRVEGPPPGAGGGDSNHGGGGGGAEGPPPGAGGGDVLQSGSRSAEGLQGGPDAGDVRLQNGGTGSPMEKAISIPSRGDVQRKPMSELVDSLEQNRQAIEERVANNLLYLLENRVGVHGTDKKGMDGITNDGKAKGDGDFCLATPATQPANAAEYIKQFGTALQLSDDYATNAMKTGEGYIGLFRLPNENEWAGPGLPYSDISCEKKGLGPDKESIGEVKTFLTKRNFDQMMVGWMDRSNWSDLERPFPQPLTDDQADRNKIGAMFAKQAMVSALLNKLGVDAPVDKSVQPPMQDSVQNSVQGQADQEPTETSSNFMQRFLAKLGM